jgi:hypothetical protein
MIELLIDGRKTNTIAVNPNLALFIEEEDNSLNLIVSIAEERAWCVPAKLS